jgi:hypothetical protein
VAGKDKWMNMMLTHQFHVSTLMKDWGKGNRGTQHTMEE